MNDPEDVDPSNLRPGPIRHESLPAEVLDQIKAVFDVIGPYIGMRLEQFEIGFMRDMHSESEVALWCSITAAWLIYHEKFLNDEALPVPTFDKRRRTGPDVRPRSPRSASHGLRMDSWDQPSEGYGV